MVKCVKPCQTLGGNDVKDTIELGLLQVMEVETGLAVDYQTVKTSSLHIIYRDNPRHFD